MRGDILTLCKCPVYDNSCTTNLASSDESCLKKLLLSCLPNDDFSISIITSTAINRHPTVIKELPFPPFIYCIRFRTSWTILSIIHLLSLFSCSNVPDVAIGSYFRLASVSLQCFHHLFFVLPYFFTPKDVLVSHNIFI